MSTYVCPFCKSGLSRLKNKDDEIELHCLKCAKEFSAEKKLKACPKKSARDSKN